MGALRRCKEDYFVWATLLVVLELLICGRVMGSCRDGMEASADDHHYNGHGGQNLEFVSHDDDHSHHGSGHSQCHGHGDHHHHHHHHHHKQAHDHGYFPTSEKFKLPEELEEEEDLRLYGFDSQYSVHGEEHAHADDRLSTTGLWVRAMGSSLLVSMASLICLMIIPVIVLQGKPSKTVVDSLAAFGAGAMLGDAFLHQLPHALGGSGKHSHSHSHSLDHGHNHNHIHSHSHASIDFHAESHSHSLEELAVGLAALAGIILFFLVEKIVRYVEELSAQGVQVFHHGHHHHHKSTVPSKKHEGHDHGNTTLDHGESGESDQAHEVKSLDATADGDAVDGKENWADTNLRKRRNTNGADKVGKEIAKSRDTSSERLGTSTEQSMPTSASNLVLGYLNLFSDGVHNFTDGMALGSAFLLHGSVGGWSRTLFLLAHELPQEIGDFGILVSSGFGVFKALLFNFLSALVALAGTALALLIGEDPGHSSWIEGFTAGGFIYIALAGVLPEMHQKGASFRSTLLQLTALTLGMGVALCISLWE